MKRKEKSYQQARELRKQGYSYTEICRKVPVSKSSISLWCRDIPLSLKQQRRLKKLALEGASRARERWNSLRRTQKEEFLQRISIEAQRDIGRLSQRDRFIAGLMLYAGEGDKTGERVGVSNANPQILRFALDWLCDFLFLDRAHFVAHLYLHVGLSEKNAKRFWAETLRLPESQIKYIYRPITRASHKKNIHQFGICSVRYHNKTAHRNIMGWIGAVLNNHNTTFPGSSMAEQVAVYTNAASSSN